MERATTIIPLLAPALTGLPLRAAAWVIGRSPLGPVVSRLLLNLNGPHRLRELADRYRWAAPVLWPVTPLSSESYRDHQRLAALTDEQLASTDALLATDCSEEARLHALSSHGAGSTGSTGGGLFEYWSIEDYHRFYRCGWTTPSQVAERILAAVHPEANTPLSQLRLFSQLRPELTRAAAAASDARYALGQPLSVFDGVPVAVKDEIHAQGWVTQYGTEHLGLPIEATDDLLVARLRAQGMVIVGKTTLTEYGTSPIGFNPRYQGIFNPHNASFLTGGSSGGSAGAVAAGVVPYAVGFDGGGSIRLPSAVCGVVGLATTFARVPFGGAGPRFSTVHTGPIAATPRDAARIYRLLAEPSPDHYTTAMYANGALPPPPPHLGRVAVRGLRVGVYWQHFDDCSPEVRGLARAALQRLEEQGAVLVNVTVPHLAVLSLAHALTIATEFSLLLDGKHGQGWPFEPQSLITLAVGRAASSMEHAAAAVAKGWGIHHLQALFDGGVDVMATPTYADPQLFAYRPAMAEAGESDTTRSVQAMKYIFLTNLLGFPGLTVPVGHDPASALPVGLHLMANHWQDATLLSVAADLFQLTRADRRPPTVFFDPLSS